MHSESHFRKIVEEELSKLELGSHPSHLYEPIRYTISLGGKRLRPVILLMSNELFGGNPEEVLQPALGIEVFHNFTLLHDDIMDKAPLRRSRETVHKKWNSNIAILSGDAMFVLSCKLMMNVKNEFTGKVMENFLQTALHVCEGQQMDMDFENDDTITLDDYFTMNSLKTASLLGCSCYIGAICAGASVQDALHMSAFGKNLGIAFQLHDDILDVYGDAGKFGKQVGGDILSNKKTFLLLKAIQNAGGEMKVDLQRWLNPADHNPANKIEAIVAIFEKLGVKKSALDKKDYYFNLALSELDKAGAESASKYAMVDLAKQLMNRES
jgi:geranylgeranyl diphosphate synthase, type II